MFVHIFKSLQVYFKQLLMLMVKTLIIKMKRQMKSRLQIVSLTYVEFLIASIVKQQTKSLLNLQKAHLMFQNDRPNFSAVVSMFLNDQKNPTRRLVRQAVHITCNETDNKNPKLEKSWEEFSVCLLSPFYF